MATFSFAKSLRLGVPGLLFLVAICGTPRAYAQSQFYCWVAETPQSNPYAEEGHPAYFTALISAQDKDHLARGLFAQYVEKKYSVRHHGPPYCTQLTRCPQGCQSSAGTNLQERIEWVKKHGGTAVMTDWTPDKHEMLMAEAAKNPVAPSSAASSEKKSAPPPAGQAAYEKAMAAQRPQSVSKEQLAAAEKAATPAKTASGSAATTASSHATSVSEKYVFCYSTGSPYRGPGESHYYVTQIFPAPPGNSHPSNAFAAYLKAEHRQEDVTGTTCSTPGSRDAEESTRQSYIGNQRKFPNRAIVETSWKPEN